MEENGLNIRRIFRVRIPLPKKSIGWAVGDEKTRPVVTMAGIDHIFREWDDRVVKGQSVVNRSHGRMRRIRHGFESHFQTSP